MRIGVCGIQQSLTPEAANLVKLAISLARRRGHAQVTPLHVASAMLASSTSLLRTACLQSHSHPLQLKALELCFNVALNRLPSSSSSPLLGPQTSVYYPSLSNALVAAFKRAQTHQRRGSIENQQQPILALKIEVEQLVISILDDPSVSRVMSEAGFSSTHVKINVEQVVSMEFCSQNHLKEVRTKPLVINTHNVSRKYVSSSSQYEATSKIRQINQVENDDVQIVLQTMINKKTKSVAIIGETLAAAETVANGVMSKIEAGADGILRYMQFTSLFNLPTLRNLSKQDVEQSLVELKGVIKSCGGRGMALYLGDLKWVAEIWSSYACDEHKRSYWYNPVEHIIMELRNLIFGHGDSGRVWLVGTASSQTYMKCKLGHPSLESLLEFHPVKVPTCSLDLTLKIESDFIDESKVKRFEADTGVKYNREYLVSTTASMSSKLPSWLQQCKDDLGSEQSMIKKCSLRKKPITEKDLILSMSTPCSPTSVSSSDQPNHTHISWPVICESKVSQKDDVEPNMDVLMKDISSKPDLLSNPNSSPNSATSSEVDMDGTDDEDDHPKFKELNDENIQVLCNAMEKNVPWQKGAILEIARTVLECRSRSMKRKGANTNQRMVKEETWMCFVGDDHEGKKKVAQDLAQFIFGSMNDFVSVDLTQSPNGAVIGQKRKRDELQTPISNILDMFAKAVYENPHCVFYVEGFEHFDASTEKGLQMVIQNGSVQLQNGGTVHLEDAIMILSRESLSSSVATMKKRLVGEADEGIIKNSITRFSSSSLDLNVAVSDEASTTMNSVCNGILETLDRIVVFQSKELSCEDN